MPESNDKEKREIEKFLNSIEEKSGRKKKAAPVKDTEENIREVKSLLFPEFEREENQETPLPIRKEDNAAPVRTSAEDSEKPFEEEIGRPTGEPPDSLDEPTIERLEDEEKRFEASGEEDSGAEDERSLEDFEPAELIQEPESEERLSLSDLAVGSSSGVTTEEEEDPEENLDSPGLEISPEREKLRDEPSDDFDDGGAAVPPASDQPDLDSERGEIEGDGYRKVSSGLSLIGLLKSRLLDVLIITTYWFASYFLASKLMAVPVLRLIGLSAFMAVALFFILGTIYFFLFLFFMGKTPGDLVFRRS